MAKSVGTCSKEKDQKQKRGARLEDSQWEGRIKYLCLINTRSKTYISVIFCAAKINIIEHVRDNVRDFFLE